MTLTDVIAVLIVAAAKTGSKMHRMPVGRMLRQGSPER